MRLTDVAKGWYYFMKGSPETKKRMEDRLAICDSCPAKVQLSEAGIVLIQAVNSSSSVFKCQLCSCPLSALTATPKSGCLLNRW